MENKTCSNCCHFIRHYIKTKKRYFPINCGHCTYPRIKDREPHSPACKNFSDSQKQHSP